MHFSRFLSRMLHRAASTAAALVLLVGCADVSAPTRAAPSSPSLVTSTCSLGMTDDEAEAAIATIGATIDALEASGALNSGQANALRKHLQNILKSIASGNYCAAKSQIQAFNDQVKEFVDGGILTPTQGGTLTDPATEIVEGFIRFASIQPGSTSTCGLSTAGIAYCWGSNLGGQLGDGTTTNRRATAGRVAGELRFKSISGSGAHTCALTDDGTAYCWGLNNRGQLGDGTTTNRFVPTAVSTSLRFTSIHAAGSEQFLESASGEGGILGGGHTCALTATGAAYCWGYNSFGTSGDGTTIPHLTPTLAALGALFTSITTSENHSCGITVSGIALCWGFDLHGQLGIGNPTGVTLVPTPVFGNIPFASLSAGVQHTCGVIAVSGYALCWGFNGPAALGGGVLGGERHLPTPVGSLVAWSSVGAGAWFGGCALATTGTAYCWGLNTNGVALGMGSTPDVQPIPAPVAADLGLHFSSLNPGIFHTCGVSTTGRGYCWGYNANGTVGDGTLINRDLPVIVKGAP